MKLGRILKNDKIEYGVQYENNWYKQDVNDDLHFLEQYQQNSLILNTHENLKDMEFEWLPPLARPGKILCVGRNYADHSKEQGKSPETKPIIFSKYSTSMAGHMSVIPYPSHTNNLDYEVELGVVIGKTASKLKSKNEAWDHIFGYTICNDLTARDVQKSEKQWTMGKAFDNSLPIGPYIIPSDTIPKPTNNEIWLTINGEKRQLDNTKNMIFSIPYLIYYISQNITLEPTDIILTGTPAGVGFYMSPKNTLQQGDQISSGVSSIGELRFSIK